MISPWNKTGQRAAAIAAVAFTAIVGIYVASVHGKLLALLPAAVSALAGAYALSQGKSKSDNGSITLRLIEHPGMLSRKRKVLRDELAILEDAQELQRGVFEVSAELVGCVEETDARNRFASAMRRYWSCASADLMVWERGTWRSLGGPATGAEPSLKGPVALPEENNGDLVLDLSPGVSGQAALVLRQAVHQPSLENRAHADQRYVAEVLRGQLALSLRRVVLYAELQELARHDPLTGTHRRWYGEHRLDEFVNAGEVISVAMVDIDFFKRINDEHGHAAGDQVLSAIGRALSGNLRSRDLVCRYGGEEFLVILPDASPQGAEMVGNRLRESIAALQGLPHGVTVTVSIGLASCHQDETASELVRRADQALYEAKSTGRNRVACASDLNMGSAVRVVKKMGRRATDKV